MRTETTGVLNRRKDILASHRMQAGTQWISKRGGCGNWQDWSSIEVVVLFYMWTISGGWTFNWKRNGVRHISHFYFWTITQIPVENLKVAEIYYDIFTFQQHRAIDDNWYFEGIELHAAVIEDIIQPITGTEPSQRMSMPAAERTVYVWLTSRDS